jgi:hypothetical protein
MLVYINQESVKIAEILHGSALFRYIDKNRARDRQTPRFGLRARFLFGFG